MIYDIRARDSGGTLLTSVEAATYFEAAQQAAQRLFKKPIAIRQSGWGGRAGVFSARSSVDDPPMIAGLFHVGEKQ
jgi:hypothetical protein